MASLTSDQASTHHVITPHQPMSLSHPTKEWKQEGFPVCNDRPAMSWQSPEQNPRHTTMYSTTWAQL